MPLQFLLLHLQVLILLPIGFKLCEKLCLWALYLDSLDLLRLSFLYNWWWHLLGLSSNRQSQVILCIRLKHIQIKALDSILLQDCLVLICLTLEVGLDLILADRIEWLLPGRQRLAGDVLGRDNQVQVLVGLL